MLIIVEFCDKCEGILLPSEESGRKVLKCTLCGSIKNLNDDLKESYIFKTKIEHPKGTEFKNVEKERKWVKKLIRGKNEK